MLDCTARNPRAVIGGNKPPPDQEPTAIELAKPIFDNELGAFLNNHPVITNDDESREGKALADRIVLALKGVEAERDGKVRPLNERVADINTLYHKYHNTNDKKPGLWNVKLRELWIRLTKYARAEEDKRQAAALAARMALEEAERKAREAEEAAWRARDEAEAGVCDTHVANAIEQAKAASDAAFRARNATARAERNTKVRIVGGIGHAKSLRDVDTLHVTDWKAAIEEMLNDDGNPPIVIVEAIITAARAYRKACRQLPAGISQEFERSL